MTRQFVFFDDDKILDAVDKATRRNLSKFGAYVRQRARRSIRKRKKASAPGAPPSSHTGNLKRGIVFGYDRTRGSVVVGPIKNRSGVAPQTLEHGGFTRDLTTPEFRIGAKAPVRWARGKRRMIYVELATERDVETAKRFWEEAGKRPAAYVPARPYMGPALDAELPRAPELWRHSVVR